MDWIASEDYAGNMGKFNRDWDSGLLARDKPDPSML